MPHSPNIKSAFDTREGFFYKNFLVHPHVCRMEYSFSKLPLPVEEFHDYLISYFILLVYVYCLQPDYELPEGRISDLLIFEVLEPGSQNTKIECFLKTCTGTRLISKE